MGVNVKSTQKAKRAMRDIDNFIFQFKQNHEEKNPKRLLLYSNQVKDLGLQTMFYRGIPVEVVSSRGELR